jgi:hypothetical protein
MSRPLPLDLGFDGRFRPDGDDPDAVRRYAAILDEDVPRWYEADEQYMYPELVAEALLRRGEQS